MASVKVIVSGVKWDMSSEVPYYKHTEVIVAVFLVLELLQEQFCIAWVRVIAIILGRVR